MTVLAVMTDHTNARWAIPGLVAASGQYPQYSTSATNFDTDWSSCALQATYPGSYPVLDLEANYAEFWLHTFMYTGVNTITSGASLIEFWSEGGTLQLGAVVNASGLILDMRKSTNGTSFAAALAGTFTLTAATQKTLDIHVKISASVGEIHAYVDGVLVYTFTGDTSTNGDNAIRYVIFKTGRNAATDRFYSQVVAATTSTVGWKVHSLPPLTGTQDFSQWTGAYSEIDDFISSGTDTIFTDTVNDVSSFPIGDVPLVASSAAMVPQAVMVSGKFLAETGATPGGVSVGFSLGSVFWGSAAKTVSPGDGEVLCKELFHVNPSNGSAWDYTELDAAQIAFKATA